MTDEHVRLVPMSAEQAQILEDVGCELMGRNDGREMKLLALSLAYKFSPPLEPPLPDNVIPLSNERLRAALRVPSA